MVAVLRIGSRQSPISMRSSRWTQAGRADARNPILGAAVESPSFLAGLASWIRSNVVGSVLHSSLLLQLDPDMEGDPYVRVGLLFCHVPLVPDHEPCIFPGDECSGSIVSLWTMANPQEESPRIDTRVAGGIDHCTRVAHDIFNKYLAAETGGSVQVSSVYKLLHTCVVDAVLHVNRSLQLRVARAEQDI